jgi:hydroxymethylpyrimidine pyrophosphatase-like HAD family hydrolase
MGRAHAPRRARAASARFARVRVGAVACDLDGTLLCSDGSLTRRTLAALRGAQRAGALLAICTARPPRWTLPLLEQLDKLDQPPVAICSNGAVVIDPASGAELEVRALPPRTCRTVVARLSAALPGGAWAVERARSFAHEPAYVPAWPVPAGTAVAPIEALIGEPVVKLLLRHRDYSADAMLTAARRLVGGLVEASHSNSAGQLLEICAPGVSKATALAALCAARGIPREQVIAFGDMPNDLPMLRWAGRGIAVANAHPEVLAEADELTHDNDSGGVAAVLERVFAG